MVVKSEKGRDRNRLTISIYRPPSTAFTFSIFRSDNSPSARSTFRASLATRRAGRRVEMRDCRALRFWAVRECEGVEAGEES